MPHKEKFLKMRAKINKRITMSGKTMMKNKPKNFKKTDTDFLTEDMRIFMKSLRRTTSPKNAKMLHRDLINLFHLKNQSGILIFHKEDSLSKEEEEAKANGLTWQETIQKKIKKRRIQAQTIGKIMKSLRLLQKNLSFQLMKIPSIY